MCSFDWYWVNALHFESVGTSSEGATSIIGFIVIALVSVLVLTGLIFGSWRLTRKQKKTPKIIFRIIGVFVSIVVSLVLFGVLFLFWAAPLLTFCSPPPMIAVTGTNLMAAVQSNTTYLHQAAFDDSYRVKLPDPNYKFRCANANCSDVVTISEDGSQLTVLSRGRGHVFTCVNSTVIWIYATPGYSYENWGFERFDPSIIIPNECFNYGEIENFKNLGRVALPPKYNDTRFCFVPEWLGYKKEVMQERCVTSVALLHEDDSFCSALPDKRACEDFVQRYLNTKPVDLSDFDSEHFVAVKTDITFSKISLKHHLWLKKECNSCDVHEIWKNETSKYPSSIIVTEHPETHTTEFYAEVVIAQADTDRDGVALFNRSLFQNDEYEVAGKTFKYEGQNVID